MQADIDELSEQYVEIRLLQLELLDQLIDVVRVGAGASGAASDRLKELQQRADRIAKEFM